MPRILIVEDDVTNAPFLAGEHFFGLWRGDGGLGAHADVLGLSFVIPGLASAMTG